MSRPISATITCALSVLTPGMLLRSSTALRKGSIRVSTSRSMSAMPSLSPSICRRCSRSRKQCCFVTRPRSASRSRACEALIRPSARAASLSGSVSPAMSASIIARPLRPSRSEMVESSLMLASSSVFWSR